METIRAFIALDLLPAIQQALHEVQNNLKKSGAFVRWVSPGQIHITLKFLGDTPLGMIPKIADTLKCITSSLVPFQITVDEVGAFPTTDHPEIIWVGIREGYKEVTQLAEKIEAGLKFAKVKSGQKEFKAHITLGRTKSTINRLFLVKALKAHPPLKNLQQKINNVTLYKSTLTAQGPIYEVLERIFF